MTRVRMLAAVSALVALIVVGAHPSFAQQTSVEITVDVTDARKAACTNGTARWSVDADITVANTSEGGGEVSAVRYEARYKVPGQTQATAPAAASNTGGLTPGTSIPPGESRTYSVTVETGMPCSAVSAALVVAMDFVNGHKTFSASDEFLTEGTPVPVASIGMVTAAAVGGLVWGGRSLGRRRRVRS